MSESEDRKKLVAKRTSANTITTPCSVSIRRLNTSSSHLERAQEEKSSVKRKLNLSNILTSDEESSDSSDTKLVNESIVIGTVHTSTPINVVQPLGSNPNEQLAHRKLEESLEQISAKISDKLSYREPQLSSAESDSPQTPPSSPIEHPPNQGQNQINILPATLNHNSLVSPPITPKPEIEPEMATFTPFQMVELVPKCANIKDVEQFVTTVDALDAQITEANKPIFLAIVKAKIVDKAFNAIKGKNLTTWIELKRALETGLDERVDMATASNKLTHIKQKPSETLKEYVERVKEALAILDKAAIREFANETIRTQVLRLNDANAKNTFEAGMSDNKLKTVVVAAQRDTFNASYTFALNQAQTNFPEEKPAEVKPEVKKNTECYYCHKIGHISKDCFTRKNRLNRSNSAPPRIFNSTFNRTPFDRFNRRPDSSESAQNTSNNNDNRYNNGNRYDYGNNRTNTYTNNNNRNGNGAQGSAQGSSTYRPNWNRPNYSQNSNSNTTNNKNNGQTRNVRMIREENEGVDWNEIMPIDDSDNNIEGN
jgi:hypothetical protein